LKQIGGKLVPKIKEAEFFVNRKFQEISRNFKKLTEKEK